MDASGIPETQVYVFSGLFLLSAWFLVTLVSEVCEMTKWIPKNAEFYKSQDRGVRLFRFQGISVCTQKILCVDILCGWEDSFAQFSYTGFDHPLGC